MFSHDVKFLDQHQKLMMTVLSRETNRPTDEGVNIKHLASSSSLRVAHVRY